MEDKKLNKEEIKTLGFASTAHSLVHAFMLIYPAVLLPIMKEFDLSVTEAGFLGTISYLMFGLGAIPAGWLTDRFGSRGLVLICLVGSGAAAVVIGLSHSYSVLAMGLLFLGGFTGLYHPAGLALISMKIRNTPRALGYHGIFGNIGLAGAPLIAGMLSSTGDWRDAYFFFGIISVIAAIYFIIFPVTKKKMSDNSANQNEPETLFPEVIIFFLTSVVFGFIYRGALTFMPYLFSYGVTLWESVDPIVIGGSVTAAALFVGMLGQWLGGRAAEKYSLTRVLIVLWLFITPALLLMGTFSQYPLILSAFVMTIFIFAGQPAGNTLLATYISMKSRGKGYGLNIAIGFGLGSFAPTICGYIAERSSIGDVFIFLGLIAPIGIGLTWWLTVLERRRKTIS
ncbi:MAG: MFS transporter [Candidatus Marinimicrobia bacterium]|nr:MFS transporter [Candidatus Neomarinimicrobiota bacterium]